MIAIAKAIKGSMKGVRYGNDQLKLFVDADGKICQGTFNLSSNDPQENWLEMKAIANLSRIKNPFVTAVLSPTAAESRPLQYEDWKEMALKYAKEFGFHDNQWRWDVHGNTDEKHLHIYACRIAFTGKNSVKEARIGLRSGNWAEKFSKQKGWKTLEQLSFEKKMLTTKALRESLRTACSLDQLKSELEKRGYTFQLSFSTKNDSKRLNGMRIMTIADAEKREKRQRATDLAVTIGKDLLPANLRNKTEFSIKELEYAKELGMNEMPENLWELVLSSAEIKTKPGFTLTELEKDKSKRIKIGDIISMLQDTARKAQVDAGNNENRQRKKEVSAMEVLEEIAEILLEPSYNVPAQDDLLWKKKRKRR